MNVRQLYHTIYGTVKPARQSMNSMNSTCHIQRPTGKITQKANFPLRSSSQSAADFEHVIEYNTLNRGRIQYRTAL